MVKEDRATIHTIIESNRKATGSCDDKLQDLLMCVTATAFAPRHIIYKERPLQVERESRI